jgi:hypothetical protein
MHKVPQFMIAQQHIDKKHSELGGNAWAAPTEDMKPCPDGIGFFRRFGTAMIYWTPATGAHEVHGDICRKWSQLGFERSWLGYPVTDEMDFAEGGRVSSFEHGEIYWWRDTGSIDLNQVRVDYTGLHCFGTTDWDSSTPDGVDEPYAIFGLATASGDHYTKATRIYSTDAGSIRPDLMEVYTGKPYGLVISVQMMEHDSGDPNKYKAAVTAGVGAVVTGATAAMGFIPIVGPGLAAVAGPLLTTVAGDLVDAVNGFLDTGDDVLGLQTIQLTAKQMVVMAHEPNKQDQSIGYKVVSKLFDAQGSSYKVHFGIVPV